MNKSISECPSEQINNDYNFTPGINFCFPKCRKHETLLPKTEVKSNIEGLGHDLGLARELAVSTSKKAQMGEAAIPAGIRSSSARSSPSRAGSSSPCTPTTSTIGMRKRSTQEQRGKRDNQRHND